jgi:hypothetical protein
MWGIGNPLTSADLMELANPDVEQCCPHCKTTVSRYHYAPSKYRDRYGYCSASCGALATIPRKKATYKKRTGYEHPSQNPECAARRLNTFREKFGVDNPFQSEKVKAKARKTLKRKYGANHPSKVPELVEKRKATQRERYGVDHWSQDPNQKHKIQGWTKESAAKSRATLKERTGYEHAQCIPENKERIIPVLAACREAARKTNRGRYGVDFPMQNEEKRNEMFAKSKVTCLKKYGCDNPFSSKEVQDKMKRGNVEKYGVENPGVLAKFRFKRKTVVDVFNIRHVVQGHEDWAIQRIGEMSSTKRIVSSAKDIPVIKYTFEGKERNYYPDLLIETIGGKTHVVEVKSSYTLNLYLKANMAKFRAAVKQLNKKGADFWLFSYDKNPGSLIRVKNPTTVAQLRRAGIPV